MAPLHTINTKVNRYQSSPNKQPPTDLAKRIAHEIKPGVPGALKMKHVIVGIRNVADVIRKIHLAPIYARVEPIDCRCTLISSGGVL
jgi:hypothetical protein